jgi:RsiW-degrading membrane proteinase PrsW (M82 family)
MANIQAAGQSAEPETGERPLAVNGDQGLLQALTTEHFTLQTARSATIMETNGRSALFLSTVSSAVVALAFIGQVADDGQPFFLFALAVLPVLFVLGLLTYLRLAQSASEDLLYSRAINRIRRFYLKLDPSAPSWFVLSGHDDIHGATANMGPVSSSRHLLSHTATMVAVTTSMIGGVFVALAVGGLGAGRVSVAVAAAAGALVSVALTAALWRDQARRWRTAEQSMPSSNPSKPDPAARVQPTADSSPDDAIVDPDDTDPRAERDQ